MRNAKKLILTLIFCPGWLKLKSLQNNLSSTNEYCWSYQQNYNDIYIHIFWIITKCTKQINELIIYNSDLLNDIHASGKSHFVVPDKTVSSPKKVDILFWGLFSCLTCCINKHIALHYRYVSASNVGSHYQFLERKKICIYFME